MNDIILNSSAPTISQNEYISRYKGVIVYRNVSNAEVYLVIDQLLKYTSGTILLVRQYGPNLQLLWTGSIPLIFVKNRRNISPSITIGKNHYNIEACVTIESIN